MGADCSNCRCTNRDEEKILIIDNADKHLIHHSKPDARKEKLESLEKSRGNLGSSANLGNFNFNNMSHGNSFKTSMKELLQTNPSILSNIVKLQSLIRKYRDRKTYKAILKKFRTAQNYFSQDELFETLRKEKKLEDLEKSEHSYTYKTGAIFSGQWLGNFRHGRGLMKWVDGTYYEGEWNLGYAEGKGMLVYQNGDYMKGQFVYNKLNGYGECFNNELGYEYKGYWENDLQTGQGSETWPDGSEYIGLYEFGKKDGFGKYTWTDSSYYIGEWKDNKIHGLGIYYWSDGRKFAGEWKNSKMNGFGVFLWKDGRSYKGEYRDDKKHNFGMYCGNEGKRYEGNWEQGSQKKLGRYTKKDGSFKLGYWEENQLVNSITNESEIAQKLAEIDKNIEETQIKVAEVVKSLKIIFNNYLPNLEFETLLEF